MALPKLDVPIFELTLPLTKMKVKFRPFLVKEEKILLMASESDDPNATFLAIKQIINNCCLTEIDVEDLPVTDLEFFFLNLRARSVGEIVDLQYKCNNKVKNDKNEEGECGNLVKLKVNVLEIQPQIDPDHTNKIELSPKLGIVMRYPTMSMMENIEGDDDVQRITGVLLQCVDFIYDDENIYYKKDISTEELTEFFDNMTREQFAKVQKFFETLPKISKDLDFKCSKCGYHENINIEGIQNFFG
jgi:hypothetical protein